MTAGRCVQEGRLPSGRRIDSTEPGHDLVDGERHLLAAGVPEADDVVGAKSLDGVVERIEEHPPTELTIGDHVQPRVDLPPQHFNDGLVLERPQLGSVPGPLLGL